jgi:hypothetical protein
MTRSLVCLSSQFGGKLPFPPVGLLTDVFSAMTASVPIVFTSMICFMLLRHRRLMMRQGGALCDKSIPYLSIIAILVESAVPYAVCSWIWVVLSITSNPAIDWFNGVFTAASVSSLNSVPVISAKAVTVLRGGFYCSSNLDGPCVSCSSVCTGARGLERGRRGQCERQPYAKVVRRYMARYQVTH